MPSLQVVQFRPSGGSMSSVADISSNAFDITWQQQVSEAGSGSLSLPLDVFASEDIQPNDLLIITIDSTEAAGFIVEEIFEHTLDEGEGGRQYARLSGRGPGGFLNWGVIIPANGLDGVPVEQDRLFSWQSPQYDDTGWDDAVFTDNPGVPEGFPSTVGGEYIWGPSTTQTGPVYFGTGGTVYFRHTFTAAAEVDTMFYVSCDNWGIFYVDGQQMLVVGGQDVPGTYRKTFTVGLTLSAGDHTVAVQAYNKGALSPGPTGNHGGIRVLGVEVESDGEVTDTVVVETNEDWLCLENPDPAPGMTPGQAILIALDEIQTRGGLGWISTTFDEAESSSASDWPVVGDISTKTGTDLLTFLNELAVTYIDWVMSPDGTVLHAYVKDGYAQVGGAAVVLEPAEVTDPTTGNLLLLDKKTT